MVPPERSGTDETGKCPALLLQVQEGPGAKEETLDPRDEHRIILDSPAQSQHGSEESRCPCRRTGDRSRCDSGNSPGTFQVEEQGERCPRGQKTEGGPARLWSLSCGDGM